MPLCWLWETLHTSVENRPPSTIAMILTGVLLKRGHGLLPGIINTSHRAPTDTTTTGKNVLGQIAPATMGL